MYKDITDKFIIRTLKEYDSRTKELREEMSKQYALLNIQEDDIVGSASYPEVDNTVLNVDRSEISDISGIYRRYCNLMKQHVLDIKMKMREIIEEQETMNRIMAAYSQLEPLEKEVLDNIYRKDQNKTVYEGVEELAEKFNSSYKTIFRIRKRAVKKIIEIYDSDLTQSEIFKCNVNESDCLINKNNKYR